MNVARSTSEIQMIATQVVDQQTKVCIAQRKNIEDRVFALEKQELSETLTDLRVTVGELQTQIKITWILLMLVISGLVGVAFSVWRGTV